MIRPFSRRATALLLVALAALLLGRPERASAQVPAPPASDPGPISVGGYLAGTLLVAPGDSLNDAFSVNEAAAALLLSGTPWPRLSYFAEIEAASVSRETYTGREESEWLEVERAYGELVWSDALRLRLGRFLTPIGQWNEIHAPPLTWTTTRPLASYRPFAKSTTGAMVAGRLNLGDHDAGYALWGAPFDIGLDGGEESEFVQAAGGRVAAELLPDLYLGLSGAGYRASRRRGDPEPDDDDLYEDREEEEEWEEWEEWEGREEDRSTRALVGADLSWRIGGFQILSEATWLGASETQPAERGGFVQLAAPLATGLHLTGRAEIYDPVETRALRVYSVGLNWRPIPRLAFKVDRQISDRLSRRVVDGWLVSVSGLF